MGEALDAGDAIIVGTPTYIGSVFGQLKSFMDAMAPRWFTQAWGNKQANALTISPIASIASLFIIPPKGLYCNIDQVTALFSDIFHR